MKKFFCLFLVLIVFAGTAIGQFGQNKVQYSNHEWFFIQTKHFDIYYADGAERTAEFTASVAEQSLEQIQKDFNYEINNRIPLIVYSSHNDFQETNVTDEYLSGGVGGFTEPFKNRVVFPFEGSYEKFRHVINHELVHAVMQDMYFGGSVQNIIKRGISLQLPLWYMEGSAEFFSQGWETYTDMFIRNAILSESLPDIDRLSGYLAYRGGQAVFKYLSDTYGRQKLGELVNKVQSVGGVEQALKATFGIDVEELNERWKKSLKKEYWPDIAVKTDPDEFAKRLTDNKKDYGFYNTSPAISPQGDKIAFISDRDIFLDVYVMDANTGKIIKKIVESGRTTDYEELNILHPSLTWSPDNNRVALSTKAAGGDEITIIDVEKDESYHLPFKMPGIETVSWSYDGSKIAFMAHNKQKSDIYIYDLKREQITNITHDIFSDFNPVWTPDSKKIIFSSDRGSFISRTQIPKDFMVQNHKYNFVDLYMIDVETEETERLTDLPLSDEKYAVVSEDNDEILFISDKSGISNIYKKKLIAEPGKTILENKEIPITNSLSEISQMSLSYNGKKLAFASLYKMGYNIFLLNNPFDMDLGLDSLKGTNYVASLKNEDDKKGRIFNNEQIAGIAKKDTSSQNKIVETQKDSIKNPIAAEAKSDSTDHQKTTATPADSIKTKERKIFSGQYVSDKKEKKDSTKSDYSRFVFKGGDKSESDSARIARRNELFSAKLDEDGNFLVNKYKIDFSPDIVYANAGYSTYYGLLGTTVLSFSDVLGDHRLIGITSMQIDVKNSDYGLAYYYLKDRISYGITGFHTARFLYKSSYLGDELYRFRNYGLILSTSYPFDRFHRFDFGFSVMGVSAENLDDPTVPSEKTTYILPSISYVKDNTFFGYTSPIEGTRYNLTLFGDPGFTKSKQSFFSALYDYRTYVRFFFDNALAIRLSGGYSGGGNPQRFFLGGTENWINRSFATQNIPIESTSDYAFLTPAMPLRGYDYAEQIGTKYSLLNLELRTPLIRYLVTGPLPLLFQNILGVAFIDAGSAWNSTEKLKLIGKDDNNKTVTNDLRLGTGVGFRLYMIFLWKVDVAWKYNLDHFSKPRYYLSLGLDF
jgi:Tol biopolymer transport system component